MKTILEIDRLIQAIKKQKAVKSKKLDSKKIATELKKIEKFYLTLEDQYSKEIVLTDGKIELPPFSIRDLKPEDIRVFDPKKIADVPAQEIEDVSGKNSYIRMELDTLWDVWRMEAELCGLDISRPTRPSVVHACKLFDRIYESSIYFVENGPDPEPGTHGEIIDCLTQQFIDRKSFRKALRSSYAMAVHYDPSIAGSKNQRWKYLIVTIAHAAWSGEIKIALDYTKKIPIEMDLQSEAYTEIVRAITHSSHITGDREKMAQSVIRKIVNPLCKVNALNFLIIALIKKKQITKALALEKSGKFCSLAVIVYYLMKNQYKKAWNKIVEYEKNDQRYAEPTELLTQLDIDGYPYYSLVPWIR